MKVTAASTAAAVLLLAASAASEPSHSAPARTSRRSLQHHHNIIARQPQPHGPRNATAFELDMADSLVKRGGGGSATFYNTQTGNAGSCGQMLGNGDMVVALASPGYNVRPDACGKTIVITIGGQTHTARVMDTCPTGGGNCGGPCDIDMSPGLFSSFASQAVGKLFGVSWYYADTGMSCDGSQHGGDSSSNSNKNKNNNDNNDESDSNSDNGAAAAAASKASAAAAAKSSSAAAASSSAAASKSSASAAAKASSAASAKSASAAKHSSYLSAKSASVAAKSQASAAAVAAKQPQNVDRLSGALDGLYQMANQVHN